MVFIVLIPFQSIVYWKKRQNKENNVIWRAFSTGKTNIFNERQGHYLAHGHQMPPPPTNNQSNSVYTSNIIISNYIYIWECKCLMSNED